MRAPATWLRGIKNRIRRRLKASSDTPQPILLDWSIVERVIEHFESRQRIWATRGASSTNPIGQYFEFGCYNGDSLVDFFRVLRRRWPDQLPRYWQMFGFDSFAGLPWSELTEDGHALAGAGSYRSDGKHFVERRLAEIGCGPDRLTLIEGFYEASLTEELRNELLSRDALPSLVNIDCDYYSSTMTVLNWIEPLLRDGTLFYFDDIYFYNCNPNKGELKAIADFNSARTESGLAPAPWFDTGGRCYMYWRNELHEPKSFVFQAYVTG